MTGEAALRCACRGLVLGLLLLLVGCASSIRLAPPSGASGSAATQRSSRGNPPFYEVFGKRYYVLASSKGYDKRGVASWYGRQFHQRLTSSGERYDMYAMTAAHKTLPLPTWVEVTNLTNGRHVVVKVNDRGPFVKNRIIDLSYAAAKALDMIRNGTAPVEVRSLRGPPGRANAPVLAQTPEPPVTAPPVAAAPAAAGEASSDSDWAAGGHDLYIQVGAFAERSNALGVLARLRAGGYAKAFVFNSSHDALHRVRIGPLESVADYDRVTDGLRRLGFPDTDLVTAD